jgi:hypothetical protein
VGAHGLATLRAQRPRGVDLAVEEAVEDHRVGEGRVEADAVVMDALGVGDGAEESVGG